MIYLDMDGVVADFDSHYEFHFGVRPTRWPAPDNVNWNRVNSVPDFYRTIPLMPDAYDLVSYVDEVGDGCGFLTGIPSSIDASANQKIEWAAEKFPTFPITCCRARDKWKHGKPGDILIDDYLRYRSDWVNMGGIFIHHTSAAESIAALKALGKLTMC